jgi:hypothetical protein
MANGTKVKTAIDIKQLTKRWEPLPQDLLLRQWILRLTKGALKKRIDPVAWQRKIRMEDSVREEKIHRLIKKRR